MANPRESQNFVPIKEVRDGVAILNDGSFRALVMASSVNFALKSSDEQNSILFQFQNFLNSLDFDLQIFVQSKKLDIRPYMALLEEQYKNQTTELMKIQVQEYIDFIKTFVENSNIMTKTFFIVVPYAAPILGKSTNPISRFMPGNKKVAPTANEDFEEYRSQLEQRVGVVEQGLVRCGVRVVELGTEEVIELFYKIFNPGDTEKPMQIT
jgi:coenzyme F420-reducing hydrogenase alpha subunit